MTKPFTGRKRIRKDFGRIGEITRMPNLIEVQKSSYDQFLQIGVTAEKRDSIGLQEVIVGALLHLDQVRHPRDLRDAPKALANTLAAGERLRRCCHRLSRPD